MPTMPLLLQTAPLTRAHTLHRENKPSPTTINRSSLPPMQAEATKQRVSTGQRSTGITTGITTGTSRVTPSFDLDPEMIVQIQRLSDDLEKVVGAVLRVTRCV